MKTLDLPSISFSIPWDCEVVLETKNIKGLVKTTTRQDVEKNNLLADFYFDSEESKQNWADYMPNILRRFII